MKNEMRKYLVQFADWLAKLLIVGVAGLLWKVNEGQTQLLNTITVQQSQIAALQSRVTVIESKMVGWDTITRIERSLGMMAAMGKGNQAMAVVADVLKAEREARNQR
jgi:hypothetical protein